MTTEPMTDAAIAAIERRLQWSSPHIKERQTWKDTAALAAEVRRLRDKVTTLEDLCMSRTIGVTCLSCGVEWNYGTAGETCPSAHREEWGHEWVDQRHRDNSQELLNRHVEIERLRADIQNLVLHGNQAYTIIGQLTVVLQEMAEHPQIRDTLIERCREIKGPCFCGAHTSTTCSESEVSP